MKFMVTIELGDDAMRSPSDVSYVLSKLAESIRHRYTEPFGTIVREDYGILMDVNGNTVGSWEIAEERVVPVGGKVNLLPGEKATFEIPLPVDKTKIGRP